MGSLVDGQILTHLPTPISCRHEYAMCVAINQVLLEACHQGIVKPSVCVAVNQVLLEARHQGIVKPSVCVTVNQVLLEACHQGIVKPSGGDPEEQSSRQHVTCAPHQV